MPFHHSFTLSRLKKKKFRKVYRTVRVKKRRLQRKENGERRRTVTLKDQLQDGLTDLKLKPAERGKIREGVCVCMCGSDSGKPLPLCIAVCVCTSNEQSQHCRCLTVSYKRKREQERERKRETYTGCRNFALSDSRTAERKQNNKAGSI